MENVRIECFAKPITHAIIHFKNDEERNKFVRSANMLKKELQGRKLEISRSMDANERFHRKRMVYVKYCIHEKHNIPPDSITTNWTLKHISVKGQTVVKNMPKWNPVTYIKYHDIEAEAEEQMKNGNQKNHRNDCEQSRVRPEQKSEEQKHHRRRRQRQAQKC